MPPCSASDPSSWFTSFKKKSFNFPRVCVPLCVCWYTQWPEKGIGSLELGLQVDVSCWTSMLGTEFRSCKSHICLTMQNRIADSGAHQWPLLSPLSLFPPWAVLKGSRFCYSNFIGSDLNLYIFYSNSVLAEIILAFIMCWGSHMLGKRH